MFRGTHVEPTASQIREDTHWLFDRQVFRLRVLADSPSQQARCGPDSGVSNRQRVVRSVRATTHYGGASAGELGEFRMPISECRSARFKGRSAIFIRRAAFARTPLPYSPRYPSGHLSIPSTSYRGESPESRVPSPESGRSGTTHSVCHGRLARPCRVVTVCLPRRRASSPGGESPGSRVGTNRDCKDLQGTPGRGRLKRSGNPDTSRLPGARRCLSTLRTPDSRLATLPPVRNLNRPRPAV